MVPAVVIPQASTPVRNNRREYGSGIEHDLDLDRGHETRTWRNLLIEDYRPFPVLVVP
jgi:hypothetical protein